MSNNIEQKLDRVRALGGVIDLNTFQQLLELDEPDNNEFSRPMVYNFFEQAKVSFENIDRELAKEDLEKVGLVGKFLKQSATAVGLVKVQKVCAEIQKYGRLLEDYESQMHDKQLLSMKKPACLSKIREILPDLKQACSEAEKAVAVIYEGST